MTTTAHPPAEILLQRLTDLGIVTDPETDSPWPGRYGMMPDEGDEAVAVFDTVPIMDGRLMSGPVVEHPGVQIRIRSVEGYRQGYAKAKEILDAVDAILRDTATIDATSYRIQSMTRRSGPLYLGLENGRNRHLFTINATMTVEQI